MQKRTTNDNWEHSPTLTVPYGKLQQGTKNVGFCLRILGSRIRLPPPIQKRRTERNSRLAPSGLMPGFATREMSARPSDRFSFRNAHQSILCVGSKEESFLVLSTDGLFCWTNHHRISAGGVPSFGPNPPPFPTFFSQLIIQSSSSFFRPLRNDRRTRDSRGETWRNSLERKRPPAA